ncbi:MAG TPA: hypothetical protein PLC22_05545, partial [Gordonia sp. (in: high G+C Gram-positive bacteria)]|nr:hypothetical protein [Gordonia sp. (in: high G+C Gram-positive bacteria)]
MSTDSSTRRHDGPADAVGRGPSPATLALRAGSAISPATSVTPPRTLQSAKTHSADALGAARAPIPNGHHSDAANGRQGDAQSVHRNGDQRKSAGGDAVRSPGDGVPGGAAPGGEAPGYGTQQPIDYASMHFPNLQGYNPG